MVIESQQPRPWRQALAITAATVAAVCLVLSYVCLLLTTGIGLQ